MVSRSLVGPTDLLRPRLPIQGLPLLRSESAALAAVARLRTHARTRTRLACLLGLLPLDNIIA